MIYIISIIACVYCSVHYDIMKRGNTHSRLRAYKLLLGWFIAVSGFQYMVGSDTPAYAEDFQALKPSDMSWDNIVDYGARYQPGWMIYSFICRFISDNFLILKFPIAIFLNVSVFSFFRKNSKYVFTSILLYALLDYLVLNFNVLRHSIALGFALYAISAMKENRWRSFLALTFGAYMFHNSALLLLLFPLVKCFKPNKYTISVVFLLFFTIVYLLGKIDLESLMGDILLSGYMDDGVAQVGQSYLSSDRLGAQDGFAIFSITRLFILAAVAYYIIRFKETFWGLFGFAYILFLIVSGFMPILWRYRLYVDMPFIIMLSQVIVEIVKHRSFERQRAIIIVLMYSITFFVFTKDLFSKAKGEKYSAIDQYYPYHSIFDPQINKDQMDYFQSLSM